MLMIIQRAKMYRENSINMIAVVNFTSFTFDLFSTKCTQCNQRAGNELAWQLV